MNSRFLVLKTRRLVITLFTVSLCNLGCWEPSKMLDLKLQSSKILDFFVTCNTNSAGPFIKTIVAGQFRTFKQVVTLNEVEQSILTKLCCFWDQISTFYHSASKATTMPEVLHALVPPSMSENNSAFLQLKQKAFIV